MVDRHTHISRLVKMKEFTIPPSEDCKMKFHCKVMTTGAPNASDAAFDYSFRMYVNKQYIGHLIKYCDESQHYAYIQPLGKTKSDFIMVTSFSLTALLIKVETELNNMNNVLNKIFG